MLFNSHQTDHTAFTIVHKLAAASRLHHNLTLAADPASFSPNGADSSGHNLIKNDSRRICKNSNFINLSASAAVQSYKKNRIQGKIDQNVQIIAVFCSYHPHRTALIRYKILESSLLQTNLFFPSPLNAVSLSHTLTHAPRHTLDQQPRRAAIKVAPIIMIMNLASVCRPLSPGNEFVPKGTAVIAH